MNTHTDKQQLKKWIDQIEDQAILEGLQAFRESTQKTTSWAALPSAVKQGIKAGQEDIKAGRVISNEDFWKEYAHHL